MENFVTNYRHQHLITFQSQTLTRINLPHSHDMHTVASYKYSWFYTIGYIIKIMQFKYFTIQIIPWPTLTFHAYLTLHHHRYGTNMQANSVA
jgi:hypothetical protein